MSDHLPHQAALAAEDEELGLREQDRLLPIANVSRIMKRGLPDNAKIAEDAKECVQECVSEFISFITSEGALSFCSSQSLPDLISPLLGQQPLTDACKKREKQSMEKTFSLP